MQKRFAGFGLLVLAASLLGCAAPVEGTYTMTSKLTSGNCPPGAGKSSVVYMKETGVTGYLMEFAGVPGSCPFVKDDDGNLRGDCAIKTVKGSTGIVSWVLDFDSDGFTGSTTEDYRGGTDACIGTYDVKGVRSARTIVP